MQAQTSFFWEGRAQTLESQVLEPFLSSAEHGLTDIGALSTLANSAYAADFQKAFGRPADGEAIAAALAAYLRSLSTPSSRFDRYLRQGLRTALTESERRGFELFRGAGNCASCHVVEKDFTDNKFHSVSVGLAKLGRDLSKAAVRSVRAGPGEIGSLIQRDSAIAALGRFNVTKNPADIGKYRTPSLRNVAQTAPYMHDGSIPTLEAAVDAELYYRSAIQGRLVILTAREKQDLVAFLRALSSDLLEKNEP